MWVTTTIDTNINRIPVKKFNGRTEKNQIRSASISIWSKMNEIFPQIIQQQLK